MNGILSSKVLLCCQHQEQGCIDFNDHIQIHVTKGDNHLTDQEKKCSRQKHCQRVACQWPANKKIYKHPRPTILVLGAVIYLSEVISAKVTASGVQNVHGSEQNVSARNAKIHRTILCVKWVPCIIKIANILSCPSPVL